jgi:hypothetical protein
MYVIISLLLLNYIINIDLFDKRFIANAGSDNFGGLSLCKSMYHLFHEESNFILRLLTQRKIDCSDDINKIFLINVLSTLRKRKEQIMETK